MRRIFHRLVAPEEAVRIVEEALGELRPLGVEEVPVYEAAGRVLAEDVYSPIDSPPFDRSEVDGYAVAASSLYGAEEDNPVTLRVVGSVEIGSIPRVSVKEREAAEIDTGAPLPRGADSVVMVEYTRHRGEFVEVFRPTYPGENVAQAGSDIIVGDLVLRRGTLLTPREVAVLASIGVARVKVYRRPTVGIISTGNELTVPGRPLKPGKIYDANSYALYSMVREVGAEPTILGIVRDRYEEVRLLIERGLEMFDVVITSGGTSAGPGDLVYRVVEEIEDGKLLVHGLRMKPGKPTLIGLARGKLIFGLPGFPVSAMMAFHTVVRPILMRLSGLREAGEVSIRATLPMRVEGARGRRRYLPVSLVRVGGGYRAYPLLGSSGSLTTLSMADGFITIPENTQFLDEGEEVVVTLFSRELRPADLVYIGSHCPALELLFELAGRPAVKVINVGSTAGWRAAVRGEADIAGTHLLDEETGTYNEPFLDRFGARGRVVLVRGYARLQGFLVARGNPKGIRGFEDLLREDVRMVNRVKGSGTRILIDLKLREIAARRGVPFEELTARIKGYDYEAKTHSAVAAAVAQGRADVGVSLLYYAKLYNLDFIPIGEETFDLLIPKDRLEKPAVRRVLEALRSGEFRDALKERLPGYRTLKNTGKPISS